MPGPTKTHDQRYEVIEWANSNAEMLVAKEHLEFYHFVLARWGWPEEDSESPEMAWVLNALHGRGLLPDQLACFTAWAWSYCDHPLATLAEHEWRSLFELSGYIVEIGPGERPKETLTLYRGAPETHKTGWSWTSDRAKAVDYANGEYGRCPGGKVWVAQVPPEALFGRIADRQENEYIVDAAQIVIREDKQSVTS